MRPPPPATPFHTHTDTQRLANYAAHRGRHVSPANILLPPPTLQPFLARLAKTNPGTFCALSRASTFWPYVKGEGGSSYMYVYLSVCVCVCDQRQRESGRTCRLCVYPASHACDAYVHTCVRVCVCVSARGWSRPLNHPRPRQSMPHAAHEEGH